MDSNQDTIFEEKFQHSILYNLPLAKLNSNESFDSIDSIYEASKKSSPDFLKNRDFSDLDTAYSSAVEKSSPFTSKLNLISSQSTITVPFPNFKDKKDEYYNSYSNAFNKNNSSFLFPRRKSSYDGSISGNSSTDMDCLETTTTTINSLKESSAPLSLLSKSSAEPEMSRPIKLSVSKHHSRAKSLTRPAFSKKTDHSFHRSPLISRFLPSPSHPLLAKSSAFLAFNRRLLTRIFGWSKPLKDAISSKIFEYANARRQSAKSLEIEADIPSYPFLARQIFYLSTFLNLHNKIYTPNSGLAVFLLTAVYIVFNLLSAIVDKIIQQDLEFSYPRVVTGLSFIMTSFFIEVFTHKYGLFHRTNKSVNALAVAPWAAWAVFNNTIEHFALANNSSIATFQHFKVGSIITLCILSAVFTNNGTSKLSTSSWVSVFLIFIGGLLSCSFMPLPYSAIPYFNFYGILIATLYSISFPTFLISFRSYVAATRLDLMLFLRFYSPLAGLFTIFSVLSSTSTSSFLDYRFDLVSVLGVLGLASIGAVIIMSSFQLLMRLGPIPLSIIFLVKACVLLIVGHIAFGYPLLLFNTAGIVICFYGAYLWFSSNDIRSSRVMKLRSKLPITILN